jgi:hypothetical protein
LLRYLERVVGIDVPAHRRAMERRVTEAVEKGACGLVSGGFRYAIRDVTVITVSPAHSDPQFPRLKQSGDQ